ncbi:hypothetical protein ABMA28_001235 [Loxostege sticticalis]|uniref:DUF7041 domain-containing protein n=1 Tax=Loxostege sticticalis TaxID=481309 RepID=A0ABD0T128_LOXSC
MTSEDKFTDCAPEQTTAPGAPAAAPNVECFKVGVRIPPFWPEKPAIWFAQIEGQFQISGITTDATKFYYVIGQLDQQYAAEVEDIITSPPATNKYERLKTELIKRLSASRERKVKQLLDHEELGDRKPSQFLRHLQHLAGPGVPEDFLRTIWTSRLPSSTQSIIASQAKSPLEELADLADRIHDVVPPSPQVAAMSAASTSSSSMLDTLVQQVAALTRQVEALTTAQHRNSRPRSRTPFRSRDRSSSSRSESSYKKYPICWYHAKHGSQANKCMKPCDYNAGNAPGGR